VSQGALVGGLRVASVGHGLLEAPVPVGDGFIVADATRGRLLRISSEGRLVGHEDARRGIGGMAQHCDGGLVVTGRSVAVRAADGREEVVADRDPGRGRLGYNDLAVDSSGRVYVGWFAYLPASSDPARAGGVLRFGEGEEPVVVATGVYVPNGIVVDEDRAVLLVVDSLRRALVSVPLGGAEPPPPPTVVARFAAMPDGMAVGPGGRLWVASGGQLVVFEPGVGAVEVVETSRRFVTSLAFGGEDHRTVVVVSGPSATEPHGAILVGRVPVAAPPPRRASVRSAPLAPPPATAARPVPGGPLSAVGCDRCGGPWSAGPGQLGVLGDGGDLLCGTCWNAAPRTPHQLVPGGRMP
jgi:sugar lactone lactonase YvrE